MLNKVTFNKFRDIAEQVNNIDNIPQLKKTKVKTSDIGQFSFYNAAKDTSTLTTTSYLNTAIYMCFTHII